jgi:hypothetical protein
MKFDDLRRKDRPPTPTWVFPLPKGRTLVVRKLDEDPDFGYSYEVSYESGMMRSVIGTGWFSGMGTGGDNDLMDFLTAYVKAFGD